MRLSLLDRLFCTEIGISFGFGLGFFTTLLVMNHVFYLARLAISQGMPFGIALQLFVYKVPYLVAFSAPMGVLLATVLGIGRMTDHNEIAALRVCGTSLYRIAAPVVLLGCVAAVGIVVFAEGVVSIANDRYRVVFSDFMTKAPELQPVENVFFQGPGAEGNALYYAQRYNPSTQTLEGVTVIYLTGGQALRIIQAHRATYRQGGAWTFHDGEVYVAEQGRVVTTRFGAMDLNVPRTPQDLTLPPKPLVDMSLRELSGEISAARRRGADPRPFVLETHNRLAAAASSIVFALVGVPLSLRPHRSGPSIGMGLSILVLFAYYAVLIPSQLASEGRVLPPALAAWLPNGVVGALGGALLAKAAR
ncbi:MAG TPA: LptF/LptG family permease [bacterium]|nr:LptF/LptG family permease [bacterium]